MQRAITEYELLGELIKKQSSPQPGKKRKSVKDKPHVSFKNALSSSNSTK